ncbi:shikimate dehydrogenase [Shinella sp. CPCC 100929]|uniref:Shikimate dehydrogenase (NADP(+)) n=1 Tax=Shinella lacus TaxID=2654216 RepID=A0ABT1RIY7_9HYPH|nr:shikimate dehydrogenase [Shinella lacus]MCQ4634961.1 shikimate dehydrogenase [Shinella lacus]
MSQPREIRVGLIGTGIGQSKSPMLHETEAASQGLELSYELIGLDARGLAPSALPTLLAEAEAAGFDGINITHPCKQRVIPLLDDLSEDARQLGAVNTVVFREGRRTGHNTDWSGFMESFRRGLPDAAIDTVLQLGAGGAGAAVAHAALRMGVDRLLLSDVNVPQAKALAQSLNRRADRDFAIVTTDLAEAAAKADGLINATPIGMDAHPGLPLDPTLLANQHWVADIVYFPIETALLSLARSRGCRVLDGGGMAVFQAAGAFRLFTGREPDVERMLATFRAALAAEVP